MLQYNYVLTTTHVYYNSAESGNGLRKEMEAAETEIS